MGEARPRAPIRMKGWKLEGVMMSTYDEEPPVKVSETKARGGVTGHNVRYVLTFGLMGVIAPSSPLASIMDWVTSRTQHPTR